ncbi:unnamed protein product [Paramecium octaurelia]|uniref:Uncharacterized protein n=1 Tax=Paramecium octaurelia TaxID=43137 RepID=A0A8S1SZ42_PAROT|nr:unnamed protein product [Paramecium octaurelia]
MWYIFLKLLIFSIQMSERKSQSKHKFIVMGVYKNQKL